MTDNNHAIDSGEDDQVVEEFYDRLDGTEISGTPNKPLCIECPGCGVFTEVKFEVWDCEHCGETLALFVGSFASKQTDGQQRDRADANDDRSLEERINDEMVVSREDADAE